MMISAIGFLAALRSSSAPRMTASLPPFFWPNSDLDVTAIFGMHCELAHTSAFPGMVHFVIGKAVLAEYEKGKLGGVWLWASDRKRR